jgi:hypothetical protein
MKFRSPVAIATALLGATLISGGVAQAGIEGNGSAAHSPVANGIEGNGSAVHSPVANGIEGNGSAVHSPVANGIEGNGSVAHAGSSATPGGRNAASACGGAMDDADCALSFLGDR